MTGLLTRYVARSVIAGALLVLAVLVSLDSLLTFFGEIDAIGKGDYDGWTAALYILLTIPGRVYTLFPASVAIGGVLGLGALAANSEIVVMRAAGISISRIILMVMQGGIVLILIIVAVGEGVAPASQEKAERLRAAAISGQGITRGERGLWVRDGERFISIGQVLPGQVLRNVDIYSFDGMHLRQALHADRAVHKRDAWELRDIQSTRFDGNVLSTARLDAEREAQLVRPELFQLLTVSPQSLPVWQLFEYVEYLRANELETGRFEFALWKKLETPLSTLVMLLLALPIVFGSLRHAGAGQRAFLGSVIGLGYYLVSELFSHIGIVYGLAAPAAALAPVALFTAVGLVALRRTR